MEGLGAAASIIAIIQLTTAVLKLCYSLLGRTSDLQDIIQRLETLKMVLYRLNDLETRCPDGALPILSDLYLESLPNCRRNIQELQSRLEHALRAKGVRGLGKRIIWSSEKKEIDQLLLRIEQDKTMFILALSSDHAQQGVDIKQAINAVDERMVASRLTARHEAILRWLNSGLDPSKNQYNAWKKHQPTTGDWLIYGKQYTEWKGAGSHSLLWLHGIPGCGKTVLCSTVINDLIIETQKCPSVAVVYFYFDFNEEDRKRDHAALLRSLLGQLACRATTLSASIDALYTKCASGSRLPNFDETSLAFSSVVTEFERVYVVIDALDEGVEKDEFPKALINTIDLRVLVASRYQDDIAYTLKQFCPVEILANARIDDIRIHVKARLNFDPKLIKLGSSNRSHVEDVLVKSCDGMFRWVECQLDALRKCRTSENLTKALKSLPKTLDETYERILLAIDEADREYAIVAFQWLVFSARPLTLGELAEALSITSNSLQIDSLFAPEDVLAICSSLVTLTPNAELRLAHFTVKEYLVSDRIVQSPASAFAIHMNQASRCIIQTCVTYLHLSCQRECMSIIMATYHSLCGSPHTLKELITNKHLRETFSSRSSSPKHFIKCYRTDQTKLELKKIAMDQEYQLLGYASAYWDSHLDDISEPDLSAITPGLLELFYHDTLFLMWANARSIVYKGKGNLVAKVRVPPPKHATIEVTILTILFNLMLSMNLYYQLSDSHVSFDRLHDQVYKAVFDEIKFPLVSLLSKNYTSEDVEIALAKFLLRDPGFMNLQGVWKPSNTKEKQALFLLTVTETPSIFRSYSRLQLTILLRLVLTYQCSTLVDYFLNNFSTILAKEWLSAMTYATAVCTDEFIEHLIKRGAHFKCDMNLLLISTIRAKRRSTLSLLLRYEPKLSDDWSKYNTTILTAIYSGDEYLLEALLSAASQNTKNCSKNSLRSHLLIAVSNQSPGMVRTLLRFHAHSDLGSYIKAVKTAIQVCNFDITKLLVDSFVTCSTMEISFSHIGGLIPKRSRPQQDPTSTASDKKANSLIYYFRHSEFLEQIPISIPQQFNSQENQQSQTYSRGGYSNINSSAQEHASSMMWGSPDEISSEPSPLKCHCQLRFSKFEDLSRHAQTVHAQKISEERFSWVISDLLPSSTFWNATTIELKEALFSIRREGGAVQELQLSNLLVEHKLMPVLTNSSMDIEHQTHLETTLPYYQQVGSDDLDGYRSDDAMSRYVNGYWPKELKAKELKAKELKAKELKDSKNYTELMNWYAVQKTS